MLAKDVKKLAGDESTPADLRRVAACLAEHYLYPVDFQVVDAAGVLHAQGEANDMRKPYRETLAEGLR